ncbi:DUF4365 domain-containing protein [Pedobacter panaciterrae]
MKTDAQVTGINGHLFVHTLINNDWKSDWHKVDQDNDDALDGIIHIRKNGELTGECIYVQVKSGSGYKVLTDSRPNHIGINVGEKYIIDHTPRWDKLVGAVILIFVDSDKRAYWTDLKSHDSYSTTNKSIILVPKSQRFGAHSKGEFKKLGGHLLQDRDLKSIKLERSDLYYLNISKPVKFTSREFYKQWSNSPVSDRTNKGLGEVIVNRSGWRHISRTNRGFDKIFQSWQLLSAAKEIIKEVDKAYQITKQERPTENIGEFILKDFISLRAKVTFPNRQEGVIQVVLRRKRTTNTLTNKVEQKVWFYSVYEPRNALKR